jgi:hypothetical protein
MLAEPIMNGFFKVRKDDPAPAESELYFMNLLVVVAHAANQLCLAHEFLEQSANVAPRLRLNSSRHVAMLEAHNLPGIFNTIPLNVAHDHANLLGKCFDSVHRRHNKSLSL